MIRGYKKMVMKVGHRGAKAYKPENTLSGFAYAIELGVDAVEFDVRQTRDKKLIVIHDPGVDRVSNGKGLVSELTLKQIKELDVGGEKIPTLQEALDFLDKKLDKMLVELKESGYEKKVIEELKNRGIEDRAIIISFQEEALRNAREIDREIETGLVYVQHKKPIKSALELGAKYLMPKYQFIHTATVQKAHENGLKVVVWTVNEPEDVMTCLKKGVDGITSDRPDIIDL